MPDRGRERRIAPRLAVHDAEQAAHLGQRLAAGLLDDEQRLAGDPIVAVERQPRGPPWTVITLTLWAITSCRSRAIRARSAATAARVHSSRAQLEPVGMLLQLGGALRSRDRGQRRR